MTYVLGYRFVIFYNMFVFRLTAPTLISVRNGADTIPNSAYFRLAGSRMAGSRPFRMAGSVTFCVFGSEPFCTGVYGLSAWLLIQTFPHGQVRNFLFGQIRALLHGQIRAFLHGR